MENKESLFQYLPHIGFRKVKSLLAIFVGFWVWQLVRLFFPGLEVHPIFIYIYGLIEIRATSEKTVEMGALRIRATFTAMAVALPVIALLEFLQGMIPPQWGQIGVELALLLVGTLLTLIIAEKVGCNSLCGLAAAIFVILMISHADDERYIYSVLRAFQTIVGVFIAWLINVKLFPYSGGQKQAPAADQTGAS